ncbi:MAG TPA: hypothetical protein DCY88_09130 [Cyanobacteria bacterium UBA11372]|nr:hypothetical protein [Cyanobacteria bacterium UBA11372]
MKRFLDDAGDRSAVDFTNFTAGDRFSILSSGWLNQTQPTAKKPGFYEQSFMATRNRTKKPGF